MHTKVNVFQSFCDNLHRRQTWTTYVVKFVKYFDFSRAVCYLFCELQMNNLIQLCLALLRSNPR
jgi:hypothetical protein